MTSPSTSTETEAAVEVTGGRQLGRRTVLTGAAWSVPAISLAVATPAFADSGTGVTLSAPSNRVAATGGTTITASVRDSSGSPSAGAAVSFTGPAGSAFSPSSVTTDGSGVATTTFDPKNTWAAPGSAMTVTALSGSTSVSQSFSVVGSNAVCFGADFSSTPTQTPLVFPAPVVSIAAGGGGNTADTIVPKFYVALLQDGTVWTAGTNAYGELGDGTNTPRSTWAIVPGLTQVKQIALGWARVMALREDGSVMAWGRNILGGVGDGSLTDRSSATAVVGLPSDVTSIAATAHSGFALTSNGSLYSWGSNVAGELGLGDTTARSAPTLIASFRSPVASITAGIYTAYAILTDGSLWAWGWNQYGQVGDGTTTDRDTPTRVTGMSSNVIQVAGAQTTAFALLADGSVKAWGENRFHNLGNGAPTSDVATVPVGVSNLTSRAKSIFAGFGSAYAELYDGSVVAWGSNGDGQLGNGSTNAYGEDTPVKVLLPAGRIVSAAQLGSSTSTTVFIATTQAPTLALSSASNEVSASGGTTIIAAMFDAFGAPVPNATVSFSGPTGSSFSPSSATTDASGVATTSFDPRTPWAQPGSQVTVSAASGSANVSQKFTVLGSNVLGFGMGATSAPTQTDHVFPSPVARIAGSGSGSYRSSAPLFSVALLENGTVWTKGTNGYGQLGDGTTTDRSTWAQVSDVWNVTQFVVGWEQVVTLHADGTVKRWGRTTDPNPVTKPQAVTGISGVVQLAQSSGTTFALLSDGSVKAWGFNDNGNAGTGSTTPGATPTQVVGLTSGVTQIGAGYNFAGATLSDGTVRTWGLNGNGQLGDGTTTNRDTPTTPTGISKSVSAIVGNMSNAFVLQSDGSVLGCGLNDGDGELGNGQTSPAINSTFSPVSGLGSGVKQLSLTSNSGYVLLSDGSVQVWGFNAFGQLGDGTMTSRTSPVTLTTLPAGRSIVRLAENSCTSNTMYLITA